MSTIGRQRCVATRGLVVVAILGGVVLAWPCAAEATATLLVRNLDGGSEGLNDPTPAAPVGGNPGTTLGEQRLLALQVAANIWGTYLDSAVVIEVEVNFDPRFCDETSAILASAGPESVHRNFVGAPIPDTWYVQALANKLAGLDLSTSADIGASFNSSLGTTCAFPAGWYYGLDGNAGTDVDLVTVALHELAHGLGFLSLVDGTTGGKLVDFDDAYMRHLEDHSTGKVFPDMTDAERLTAMVDPGDLHWVGPATVAASGGLTSGVDPSGHVEIYAPLTFASGSSVSHYSTTLAPNELMEPAYSAPLGIGLTAPLLEDLGWGPVASRCGDGVVDPEEECDDGNFLATDGCAACVLEPCHGCTGAPSACAPLVDGTACEDGAPCTLGDTCQAGECMAGSPTTGAGETWTVDDPADAPDAAAGDGLCATAGGTCTVRAAVEEGNSRCGLNTVVVPPGTYVLTAGALAVADALDVVGSDAATTIVDGGGVDRVIRMTADLTLTGLTIQNGMTAQSGGGIAHEQKGAVLTLTDSVVTGNTAGLFGGGIYVDKIEATVVLTRSEVRGNRAEFFSGGIDSVGFRTMLILTDSVVQDNEAVQADGGGIFMGGGGTFTRSEIRGNVAKGFAGGLWTGRGKWPLTIADSVIADNTSASAGGLRGVNQTVFITDTAVTGNVTTSQGGGILITGGTVEITRGTIRGNTSGSGAGLDQAGSLVNSSVTIRESVISDNVAISGGGGIEMNGGRQPLTMAILDSEIFGNTAPQGGGIRHSGGSINTGNQSFDEAVPATLTITRTWIHDNVATFQGGGIYSAGSADRGGSAILTIADSTIADNVAGEEGGGLRLFSSDLTLTNSTLSGNTAGEVGGAVHHGGNNNTPPYEAQYTNVTITGNSAPLGGGLVHEGTAGEVFVRNTILAGNTSTSGTDDCSGKLRLRGHNLFGTVAGCDFGNSRKSSDVSGLDPLLGPLQDHGGAAPTHALAAGSPALEAGAPPGDTEPCAATDQRGVGRPQPGGGQCDIGAYERVSCPDGVIDPGEQCDDGNTFDGDGCSAVCQREWMGGKKLLVRDVAGQPAKALLKLLSKDDAITLGRRNGSIDDPVLSGATLRVVSTAGDGFDATYALPAAFWRYSGQAGQNRGYKYKDRALAAGPIKTVRVKFRAGRTKQIKLGAKGAQLVQSLGSDPNPIDVVLTLGTRTFCFSFGGEVRFQAGRRYLAKEAPAASVCPL